MSQKILIGNLPVDTTEDALKDWLDEIPHTLNISVHRNQSGKCRGFATITELPSNVTDQILENYDRTSFMGRVVFMHREEETQQPLGIIHKWRQYFRGLPGANPSHRE